jgi:putative transposase
MGRRPEHPYCPGSGYRGRGCYHPHVHCLVTGGGISDDGASWHPARNAFLVPVKALAKLVRGKLRAAFERYRPDLVLPEPAWSKPWVVHCAAWGYGEQAVLDYLARYVFRVAITNTRIIGVDDETVTIRHKHRKSNRWRTSRILGHEFVRRFLQHVLPKGLHKVRYFGLWHPSKREHVAGARRLLLPEHPATPLQAETSQAATGPAIDAGASNESRICPCCREGLLVHVRRLSPRQAGGP